MSNRRIELLLFPILALPLTFWIVAENSVLEAGSGSGQQVLFNSDWLESTWRDGRPPGQWPTGPAAGFGNGSLEPFDVLGFVLKSSPPDPVVYPSEGYYYFKFFSGERLISGNLRFSEADRGLVSLGFFDELDRGFLRTAFLKDGVNAEVRASPESVLVRFRGTEREFRIDNSWKLPVDAGSGDLEDGETLVSGILDESGYRFALIYNQAERQFAYLASNVGQPEPVQAFSVGRELRFEVGLHSRYIFLCCEGPRGRPRRILAGVFMPHVIANNFFDGPFDQVPPDLMIRSKLEEAYPYVKLRGGIDEHGNFLALAASRVAISPYTQYSSIAGFRQRVGELIDEQISSGRFRPWFGLLHEAKSVFHESIRQGDQTGADQ